MKRDGERGQALVEFAFIASILFILSLGLISVGRAFFVYTALSNAARTGARFGGVVGGTCDTFSGYDPGTPVEWCNQMNNWTSNGPYFFMQDGNVPKQGVGNACPDTYDPSNLPSPNPFYTFPDSTTVQKYLSGADTTIVGDILQHFDTNSNAWAASPPSGSGTGATAVSDGRWTAGMHPSDLAICIQLPADAQSGSNIYPHPGDVVQVYVYYRYYTLSTLLGPALPINMRASSQYTLE